METRLTPAAKLRYEAVLQLLATADSIWNASRIFFARWDLSPSQFNVLNLLRGHPSGLSQIELSRRLITHRSNVTGLTDRLEKRKLVQRRDVAGDRRAYRVVLTGAGAALMAQILPGYYSHAVALCERMPLGRVSKISTDLAHFAKEAERIAGALPAKTKKGAHHERERFTK